MSLTYLLLDDYLPLATVSMIKTIEITPTSINQIFMGGNGSGKTAIAREWSPLPPDASQFGPNGRKCVHHVYNGKTYKLDSVYRKNSFVNSFIVIDGDTGSETELNISSTITEQRALVKTHLHYDDKIHELISMTNTLTRASGDKVHAFFTLLYPHDLEFVTSLWKKIKSDARDKSGAIKHLTNKMDDYQTRLDAVIATLPDDIDMNIERLILEAEAYVPFNVKHDYSEASLLQTLDSNIQRIKNIQKQWKRFSRLNVDEDGITSLDDLVFHIGTLTGTKAALYARLTELDHEEREFTELCPGQEAELTEDELIASIDEIQTWITTHGYQDEPKYTRHQSILGFLSKLSAEATHLATYVGDRLFTSDDINSIQVKHAAISNEINKVRVGLERKREELSHLEREMSNGVICPRCHYSFGLTGRTVEDQLVAVKQSIEVLTEQLEKLTRDDIHAEMIDVNAFLASRGKFITYVSEQASLHGFSLPNLSELFGTPNAVYQRISDLQRAVADDEEYSHTLQRLQKLRHTLNAIQKHGLPIASRLASIQSEASAIRNRLDEISARLAIAERIKAMVEHFHRLIEEGDKLNSENELILRKLTSVAISNHAQSRLKNLHITIGELREAVNRRERLRENLIGCKNEHANVVDDEQALQLLTRLTSPKTGVSADYLYNFITSFIDQMNELIGVISLLDIRIHYPSVGNDGTLDCNLTASINGAGKFALKGLSIGQQRVVNLAFSLMCRRVRSLTEVTLFLDEVADGLDSDNRAHLYACIRSLTEQGICDQTYIVNHYDPLYSLLADPEVNILSSAGIVTPKNYRTSAKITYY